MRFPTGVSQNHRLGCAWSVSSIIRTSSAGLRKVGETVSLGFFSHPRTPTHFARTRILQRTSRAPSHSYALRANFLFHSRTSPIIARAFRHPHALPRTSDFSPCHQKFSTHPHHRLTTGGFSTKNPTIRVPSTRICKGPQ